MVKKHDDRNRLRDAKEIGEAREDLKKHTQTLEIDVEAFSRAASQSGVKLKALKKKKQAG